MTEKRSTSPVVVSLREVAAEMDLPNEDWTAYLNRCTGELFTVTDDDQRAAEAGSTDVPEWQREVLPKVREVLESDDFLPLPSKFEIHEYSIMERFCLGVEDSELRGVLLTAIRGWGVFRRFKAVIHERGVAEAWYEYRQQALEEIAADWLEVQGIRYTREQPSPRNDGA